MKQYYKIGEISKSYQIGPDSLRYYEELGILNPKRAENGYRLYGFTDLWRLNVIRDLRRLDFPMKKIGEYMRNRSVTTTQQLLNDELYIIGNNRIGSLLPLESGSPDKYPNYKGVFIIDKNGICQRHTNFLPIMRRNLYIHILHSFNSLDCF